MNRVSNDRAVIELARVIKALDDAHPDIGWGMSWSSAREEATRILGLTDADLNAVTLRATEEPL